MGSATDRRVIPIDESIKRSLTMNGGASLPAGGEVSVWCRSQSATEIVTDAQVMIMQVGGFF